jgi:cytoskeletal protein CcmA (bactofilin family)
MTRHRLRSRRGIALITALLVSLVVAALMVTAALLDTNATFINNYQQRASTMRWAADAGIEQARSLLNGNKALYPDSGFATIESNAPVRDANGNVIPNVTRSVYAGPTGITSGQYGVFGSVISVVADPYGDTVVRRGEIVQESFAKFAYFTDVEPSNIAFGGGDQIYGPVHSNDNIKIYSSGATFFGHVTTAGNIIGGSYATFKQGYTTNGPVIPFPQTADLSKLQSQAADGNMVITSTNTGALGQATTRIEFVAIDLNNDGNVTDDNEGFIKVYQSSDPGWVVPSDYSSNGLRNSLNCGHYEPNGQFVNAASHPATGIDSWVAAVSSSTRRCYLGGADSLWGSFQANDAKGHWLPWPGAISPLVAGRPDAAYLWPISRALNPSFKGVIYVSGNVAISGVLRGRVTLAATGNIVIADDMTYATNPGAGTCNDILGLFAGNDVVMADNTLNSPVRPKTSGNGNNYFTYDDTKDEFVDAVILALNQFTTENYASGSTTSEACENKPWGRGCLYLTGGIIQNTRGAVGTIWNVGGTGYMKRYSYDACAYSSPPPYYPTTGHFARAHYFEIDPRGFNVANYFAMLTPH